MNTEEKSKKLNDFLTDLLELYKKHGVSIAHEDTQGGFIIQDLNEKNVKWIKDAQPDFKSNDGATHLSDSDFQKAISDNKLVMVDFWAEWCGPCRHVGPVVDELANEYGSKMIIGKINVDENSETSTKFNIRSIPAFVIIKNGVEVERFVGAQSKIKIKEIIEKHLN